MSSIGSVGSVEVMSNQERKDHMKRTLLMLVALFVMFAVFTPAAGAVEEPMDAGESVAAVDQSTGQWYLRNEDGSAQEFYFGDPGDVPLFGDWDGDTVSTPGVYRQSDGRVYLRNSNTQGIADLWFYFGNPNDIPLAGDWDGDGVDTISVFRPSTNQFFINTADNEFLNHTGKSMRGWGYTVFGKVVEGQDVVDQIKGCKTGTRGFHSDVPLEDVVITSAKRV